MTPLNLVAFTLFETSLGPCGIAWTAVGVRATQLPESSAEATTARLLRRNPGATFELTPPPRIRAAIAGIVALLAGEARDLSVVALDLTGVPEFDRRVYRIALTVPPGNTLTYGDIAKRMGMPGSAQAVGQALGRNPIAIIIPCHRVLAAGGKTGGFSAGGGVATKMRMLAIEGAPEAAQASLFD